MSRPGGNPEISKHSFKSPHKEPCTAKFQLRVSPTLLEKLQKFSADELRGYLENLPDNAGLSKS